MDCITHDSFKWFFGWRWAVSIGEAMVGVGLELVVVEGGWSECQYPDVRMGLTGMVGWGMVGWPLSTRAEPL